MGDSLLSEGSLLSGARYFSGFISSHKVLTLLPGGRYFRRVVTIGTLRYRCTREVGGHKNDELKGKNKENKGVFVFGS